MKVCFFGAYDPAYPRNRILREGLRRAGCDVREACVPERRAFRRYPELLARHAAAAREADVLVVPEFRHKDMPLARWLRGRRPVVFDPLVSRHDTLVGDWGLHREGSGQARWNRRLDCWTLALGDRVLCDTWAQGRLYETLGVSRQRLRRILVGAEDAFFDVAPAPRGPMRVLYIGGFLPLHGVLTMIEAIAMLERSGQRLDVTLAGEGIDYPRARAEAERLGLSGLTFSGRIPYQQTPALMATSHIVLGAFGETEKAGRVIPHKVYQGLASGRAVVTGDGPGVREIFEPDTHLIVTPRGDPALLAHALAALAADPERCLAIGAAGRARARQIGTVDAIGAQLRAVLEEVCA